LNWYRHEQGRAWRPWPARRSRVMAMRVGRGRARKLGQGILFSGCPTGGLAWRKGEATASAALGVEGGIAPIAQGGRPWPEWFSKRRIAEAGRRSANYLHRPQFWDIIKDCDAADNRQGCGREPPGRIHRPLSGRRARWRSPKA
jgi:hypothetical protein